MLVCALFKLRMHTRPRVTRAPGIPCALYFGRGTTNLAKLGCKLRREIADAHSLVIARLDRATQYSRDAGD